MGIRTRKVNRPMENEVKLNKGQYISYECNTYEVIEQRDDIVVCTLKSYSSPRYKFKINEVRIINERK